MFEEATWHQDLRSPEDPRVQPWRAWWPATTQSSDNAKSSVLLGTSTGGIPAWIEWAFDNTKPWEKPWIHWPLSWSPAYYGEAAVAPPVRHDATFISAWLEEKSPDAISKFDPFRTTSIIQFYKERPGREAEKPYACRVPVSSASQSQSNFDGEWSQVVLTDVRGHEDLFTLDQDGFEWLQHKSGIDVLSASFDVHAYMQEAKDMLRQTYNCKEVFIFDYVQRSPDSSDRRAGFSDVTRRVHCDQSPRSGIGRIKLHMGDRAEELLKGRCRIFSVWRPLLPVIEMYPLMACSFTTVSPEELLPIDVVYPHYAEESMEIRNSAAHKWYYKSSMTVDDLMIIKLYDSKLEDNTAFCAPHGSWRDPNARSDAPHRRSIELRCILFG